MNLRFKCPVCVGMAMIGDSNFESVHVYSMDRQQLLDHLKSHTINELLEYIYEDAEDFDNNYHTDIDNPDPEL
jgi:hypothetical protein